MGKKKKPLSKQLHEAIDKLQVEAFDTLLKSPNIHDVLPGANLSAAFAEKIEQSNVTHDELIVMANLLLEKYAELSRHLISKKTKEQVTNQAYDLIISAVNHTYVEIISSAIKNFDTTPLVAGFTSLLEGNVLAIAREYKISETLIISKRDIERKIQLCEVLLQGGANLRQFLEESKMLRIIIENPSPLDALVVSLKHERWEAQEVAITCPDTLAPEAAKDLNQLIIRIKTAYDRHMKILEEQARKGLETLFEEDDFAGTSSTHSSGSSSASTSGSSRKSSIASSSLTTTAASTRVSSPSPEDVEDTLLVVERFYASTTGVLFIEHARAAAAEARIPEEVIRVSIKALNAWVFHYTTPPHWLWTGLAPTLPKNFASALAQIPYMEFREAFVEKLPPEHQDIFREALQEIEEEHYHAEQADGQTQVTPLSM